MSANPAEFLPWPILVPALFVILMMRYFLIAGGFYLLCYVRPTKWLKTRKIDPQWPRKEIIWTEIKYSFLTTFIFALSGAFLMEGWKQGWIPIYIELDKFGYPYLLFSFVLLMFLHETYFYWTHRWMHHPKIFPHVHRVHHLSYNPTPFASFSFNVSEAIVEALIVPLMFLFIPVHVSVLILFLTVMTVLGVTNHLGYELLPKGFQRTWIGKWWITSTHHYMHHRKVNLNYGLYFTFWDYWMGTHDHAYDDFYDKVTGVTKASTHLKVNPKSDSIRPSVLEQPQNHP